MPSVSFIQADMERLIKAAKKQGAVIKFNMRTKDAWIIPAPEKLDIGVETDGNPFAGNFAPDGKENWDED